MRGKARESILRVLLNNPKEQLSKYKVAKLAGCSFPWALEVLNELQKKKLVKNTKVLNYKKLVDFLIKKNKLEKILFPNKMFASSLYKKLGGEFYDYLENDGVKAKISFS